MALPDKVQVLPRLFLFPNQEKGKITFHLLISINMKILILVVSFPLLLTNVKIKVMASTSFLEAMFTAPSIYFASGYHIIITRPSPSINNAVSKKIWDSLSATSTTTCRGTFNALHRSTVEKLHSLFTHLLNFLRWQNPDAPDTPDKFSVCKHGINTIKNLALEWNTKIFYVELHLIINTYSQGSSPISKTSFS